MTILNLYRGDFEKIRRFEVSKTEKHCLVGRGVYLTTDVTIANSYRTKGHYGLSSKGFFECEVTAKSRTEAYALAFEEWLTEKARVDRALRHTKADNYKGFPLPEWLKKNHKVLKEKWDKLFDSGRIKAEYTPGYSAGVRKILVSIKENDEELGHLTKFAFDEDEFMSQMVDVVRFQSSDFWEIVFDNKLNLSGFEIITTNKDDFIALYRGRHSNVYYDKFCNWETFRRVFKQYGYRGIQYEGGRTLGGKRHSAFCVWDDDWLNEHRVGRTKLLKI